MKIDIGRIKVAARIRKQTVKIDELAADIKKNGLFNPITVMPSGEEYQLLAGLRRLRAAQSLGWTEIEVNAVTPKDAEAALNIEYSENIQREQFTFSEKMDYARLIEDIEQAKAKERMLSGKKNSLLDPVAPGPQGNSKSRDAIGGKIGMSGRQYDRAKYVAENVPPSVIDELDSGERTIRKTYDDLKAAAKKPVDAQTAEQAERPTSPARTAPPVQPITSPKPAPTIPSSAPVKESDLDRAIRAESELDAMKYRQHNEIYHRDCIIENLKKRNAELEAALTAANARIQELEAKYESV